MAVGQDGTADSPLLKAVSLLVSRAVLNGSSLDKELILKRWKCSQERHLLAAGEQAEGQEAAAREA